MQGEETLKESKPKQKTMKRGPIEEANSLLRYNSLPCGTECSSRIAAGIRPMYKKKKTFIVAVASSCLLAELCEISSYFLVGRVI